MKEHSVCFTGHRGIPAGELPALKKVLAWYVEQCIWLDYARFYCGGAQGFDLMAGFTVLEMKARYPQVELIVVQPCADQDANWDERDREQYRALLAAADQVVCLSEHYFDGCMRQRNQYLVDHSEVCLAYMKRERTGTAQTVGMAKRVGLVVHNLAGVAPPEGSFSAHPPGFVSKPSPNRL